jgi:hypothetical protein
MQQPGNGSNKTDWFETIGKQIVVPEWEQIENTNRSESGAWGLEAIKHIAILGLAGLAGTFTLVAGNNTSDFESLKIAAVLFALGSVASVISMYLGYGARLALAVRAYSARTSVTLTGFKERQARENGRTFSQEPPNYNLDRAIPDAFGKLGLIVAFVAAFAVFTGGAFLFHGVMAMKAPQNAAAAPPK